MRFVADAVRWFVDDLNRPPRGGLRFWVMVALGGLAVVLGVAGALGIEFGVNPRFALLGAGIATMGGSELVPRDRMRLVRNLRLATWGAFGLYTAWILVPPLAAASAGAQFAVVAVVAVLAGYAWLVYRGLYG